MQKTDREIIADLAARTSTKPLQEVFARILEKQNEIIAAIESHGRKMGRPKSGEAKLRGAKNTRMMKVERECVICYLEVECHRTVESCTPADCHHVWNMRENKAAFDEAAKRTDDRRGYPDYIALYRGLSYWYKKEVLGRKETSI